MNKYKVANNMTDKISLKAHEIIIISSMHSQYN